MIVQLCTSTAIVQCNRELFTGAVDAIITAEGLGWVVLVGGEFEY